MVITFKIVTDRHTLFKDTSKMADTPQINDDKT